MRMSVQEFQVQGMTCNHCRQAVERALGELPGVQSVDVDLASGRVRLSGEVPLRDIQAAIEEEGFSLAASV